MLAIILHIEKKKKKKKLKKSKINKKIKNYYLKK